MIFQAYDRRSLPAGMTLSESRGADGWRLRGYDWPVAGGAVRGSLLFQSGRADFVEKYVEALAHWHDRGWGVSGFDWRGPGGSARTGEAGGGAGWSLDAMVADLAAYAADWMARTPAPHVLVGHSMGGHLLLRLLVEQAVRPAAVVLVAPMLGLAHAPLSAAVALRIAEAARLLGLGGRPVWRRELGAVGRQARLTGCAERYADEEHWHAANPALRIEPPSWLWLAAALRSIARLDAPGVLEAVTVPMLIVATPRDRLVSASAIRRAAARLPDARLVELDGAHELLREADGVRLAAFAAIDDFLDERVA